MFSALIIVFLRPYISTSRISVFDLVLVNVGMTYNVTVSCIVGIILNEFGL